MRGNELDFKTIEKEIYKIACEVGRGIIKKYIGKYRLKNTRKP